MSKLIIGLTGPTGAGKSNLCDTAKQLGFTVIDCDKSARKATEKNSDGLNELCKVFGSEILNSDKTLNRKALARIAFSSQEKTELLNKTIFPFIKKIVLEEANSDLVLFDAPTLFESGLNSECFKTVAVLADTNIRLSRILERDNISEDDALLRINAGKDDNYYKDNADYILFNNGDEAEYIYEFINVVESIKNDYSKEKNNE